MPQAYKASTATTHKSETVHITLQNGNVKEFGIEPVPPVDPDRIVVTDAHRKNVYDPMTGAMLRVPGNGEVLSPDSCRTGAGIFDGRMRYDLKLAYKRMASVKSERGYEGPAAVCAITFVPIAGNIPGRKAITYLIAQRDMEVWLVPIAGTRFAVPYRLAIPTPLGLGVLEATQFVATPLPSRASAAVTRP